MQIWGGIECSINRVGDTYYDQLQLTGHLNRLSDLNLICNLGISKIRYPLLWERHMPENDGDAQWGSAELRMQYLRTRNVEVIAGLVHHGSGPSYANINDPSFPEGLAEYAKKVALKFPWINYYTPVNEPLTTARFCGMYGLWYPHQKDSLAFLNMLIQQCKATIMAMQAIRTVNSSAKLVFTEDLSFTHSTAQLGYQADFENQRRWLSIDLICGKVTPVHPLYEYILNCGIDSSELIYFIDNQLPPDILGFNYYITSERYLDHQKNLYPKHTHGGNEREDYADVEAVRCSNAQLQGAEKLLRQAWEKYHLPLAMTEVHLQCSREDQLRWLQASWNTANRLKTQGIDIRAITSWALIGASGWDQLLTCLPGNYESGAFEVRSGMLRATALAKMIRGFAYGRPYEHPVLGGSGWWENDSRVLYGNIPKRLCTPKRSERPLLFISGDEELMTQFFSICSERDIYGKAITLDVADDGNIDMLNKLISSLDPWGIINGFDANNECAVHKPDHKIMDVNTIFNLAVICFENDIKLLNFSSNFTTDKLSDIYSVQGVNYFSVNWTAKSKFDEQLMVLNPNVLILRPAILINTLNPDLEIELALCNNIFSNAVKRGIDFMIDDETGIWYSDDNDIYNWSELTRKSMLHLN